MPSDSGLLTKKASDSGSYGRLLLEDRSSYVYARKKKYNGAIILFVVGIFGIYASLIGQAISGLNQLLLLGGSILFILMGVFLLLNKSRPFRIYENGIEPLEIRSQFIRFDQLEYIEKESDYILTIVDRTGMRYSISVTGSKRMDRAVWNKAVAIIIQRLKETHPDKKEYEIISDNRDN